MSKQGEEYERFVQDVYKVLNANDGLSNAIVQHDVKLKGISREHQIDVSNREKALRGSVLSCLRLW